MNARDATALATGWQPQRCHVSQIGLDPREQVVLQTLFRVRPALQRTHVFDTSIDAGLASVVFVDADNDLSLHAWRTFRQARPDAVAVFVSGAADVPADEEVRLSRPLSLRRLDEIGYALRRATPASAPTLQEARCLEVLVVDDSAVARELLNARLDDVRGNVPIRVDFCETGDEALAKAAGRRYDLVFLDVEMPGLDGYEVCRRLKTHQPSRVAMLTGRNAAADYARGRSVGCDHYLAKPVSADMLRTVVRVTALKKALPVQ